MQSQVLAFNQTLNVLGTTLLCEFLVESMVDCEAGLLVYDVFAEEVFKFVDWLTGLFGDVGVI